MSARNFFNVERIPLAYFITFRCYGTWLHGDARGSIDRYHNQYDTPLIPPHARRWQQNRRSLQHAPVELDDARRAAVEAAVRETCEIRGWQLRAVHARTNHVHAVVSARGRPEPVLSACKAYATRRMKAEGCWPYEHSLWSAGGSKRYLWTARSVDRAMEYVVNGQGGPLPDFN
jgi:REP element-mobilizing transposase RayT